MIRSTRRALRGLALAGTLACFAQPAVAAAPPNDDFDSAIVVGSLPFSDTQEATEATVAPDDPSYSPCVGVPIYSIWYSFTPANDVLLDASASNMAAVLVYTGTRGNLTEVVCGAYQGTVHFQATAGTTYHFLVSVGATPPLPAWATFTLQETPPPPPPPVNDEIGSATVISALPFQDLTNTTSATGSIGDTYCAGGNTVWYAYTPTQDIRLEARASSWPWFPALSVSTGSPGQLTTLGCGTFDPAGVRLRFDAVAGVTYWIMVGTNWWTPGGPTVVTLAEAPPPFALGVRITAGSVVPSTGQATVTGTVTCSETAYVNVSGRLSQEHAGVTIEGWFWSGAFCEPGREAAWSAVPGYGLGRFRGRSALLYTGGPAEAQATASGYGSTTGEYDQESATVRLQLGGAR